MARARKSRAALQPFDNSIKSSTDHHPPDIMNPSIKKTNQAPPILGLILMMMPLFSAQAQWNKTAAGSYDYNNSSNWISGNINGAFGGTFTGAQVMTFDSDTTLDATAGNALNFTYAGAYNTTLQSDSATTRILKLNGGISVSSANTRTITVGTVDNPLTLDLGAGNVRTATVGTSGTLSLGALITGAGSSLNVGAGSGTVVFLNDNNSFTGDFEASGAVKYTSLGNAGQNSALGAGSAITLKSNASFDYSGADRSVSDRTINLSGISVTLGSTNATGTLALTGIIRAANGADRSLVFSNASGGNFEVSGQILNQTDGTKLSLRKTGVGKLSLLGMDNDYQGTTTHQVNTLEFRSIANLGQKSSLGAPVTVEDGTIHIGSNSSTTFSYIGEGNSVTNRNFSLESTATVNSIIAVNNSGSMMITGDITTLAGTKSQTLTLSGTGTGTGTISGRISDTSDPNLGLLKTSISKGGAGTWTLTGNNSYTGSTTVGYGGGILQFTSIANAGTNSSLGADGNVVLGGNGSTLKYIGSGDSVTNRVVDLNSTSSNTFYLLDASGSGSVSFGNITATSANTKKLILTGTSNTENTIAGAIGQNSATFTTALLKAGNGTWVLSGPNTFTGITSLCAGTLRLDFSKAGSPTNDIINSASALTLSGGILELKGKTSSATSQTFASTTFSGKSQSKIVVDSNGGAGTTLALKAITRSAGATVDFVLPNAGSITTTTATVTNGVMSAGGVAYATVSGSDWATVKSGAVASLIASDYKTNSDSTKWLSTDNVSLSANATSVTTRSINTLKLSDGASVALNTGQTLTLGAGGLLVVGSGAGSISGGTLKGAGGTTKELVVFQNNTAGRFDILSTIVDNTNASDLTKSGAGILGLSALNTYTGVTTINGGVLEVDKLANGGQASSIGQASNTAGNLVINGATLRYTGGVASTDRGFQIGNSGATLDASGSGAITFTGSIGFQSTSGIATTLTLAGSNTANNTLGGVLADNGLAAFSSLTKTGVGTWVLTDTHTYTGQTTIQQGKLVVNGTLSASTVVEVQNGGILGGRGSVGTVKVASGAAIAPGNSIGVLHAGNTFFEGGGRYVFELNSGGTGTAGVNWDQYAIIGSLVLQNLSALNPFIIELNTLDGGGSAGLLAAWDADVNHVWSSIITTTTGYYDAFDPSYFQVNTAGFLNNINGTFSVVQNGNALDLRYTVIPEPGTYGLVAGGCFLIWTGFLPSLLARTSARRRRLYSKVHGGSFLSFCVSEDAPLL